MSENQSTWRICYRKGKQRYTDDTGEQPLNKRSPSVLLKFKVLLIRGHCGQRAGAFHRDLNTGVKLLNPELKKEEHCCGRFPWSQRLLLWRPIASLWPCGNYCLYDESGLRGSLAWSTLYFPKTWSRRTGSTYVSWDNEVSHGKQTVTPKKEADCRVWLSRDWAKGFQQGRMEQWESTLWKNRLLDSDASITTSPVKQWGTDLASLYDSFHIYKWKDNIVHFMEMDEIDWNM